MTEHRGRRRRGRRRGPPMPPPAPGHEVGQEVEVGQTIVVLEAMKMEHSVKAPESGVVRQLLVSEGEQVEADAVLAVVSSEE